ncbi:hypothetical protein [Haladaptatus sp. DYF46]|uniref:hypothetical protein n=1 Tax=Haladaptatus sp. DYF46 TaxID=2886041 RepID=UPI001E47C6F3|nr:hypothetical protein [Haladaptatus sp. DYF46]
MTNDEITVEQLRESAELRMVWPGLVALSLFLPWVSVSGLFSAQVTGMKMDLGIVMFVLAVGIAISTPFLEKRQERLVWLIGGILLLLLVLGTTANIYDSIDQYDTRMQGNIFQDAVSIDFAYGAYIAIVGSLAAVVVGYRMDGSETGTETVSEESIDEEDPREVVESGTGTRSEEQMR